MPRSFGRRIAAHRRVGAGAQDGRCEILAPGPAGRRRSALGLCRNTPRFGQRPGPGDRDRPGQRHRPHRHQPRAERGSPFAAAAPDAATGRAPGAAGGRHLPGAGAPAGARPGPVAGGGSGRDHPGDGRLAPGVSGDPRRVHGARRLADLAKTRVDPAHGCHRDSRRDHGADGGQDWHAHREPDDGCLALALRGVGRTGGTGRPARIIPRVGRVRHSGQRA